MEGHTDLSHESNNSYIISETFQPMPITFAVRNVQLKIYITIGSPMTLTFTQGHNCVSNWTSF